MEACLITLYSSPTGTVVTLFTPELIIRCYRRWGVVGEGKRRGCRGGRKRVYFLN